MKKTNAPLSKPIRRAMDFFLMGMLVSFLAWILETFEATVVLQNPNDRGLLSMPLCPIYGFSLVLIYLLIGTPRSMRLLKKKILTRCAPLRYVVYFVLSALLASAVELAVGVFFKEVFGIYLWYYRDGVGNILGLVALAPTIKWGVFLTAFMRLVFDPILRWLHQRSDRAIAVWFYILLVLLLIDSAFNFTYLIIHGARYKLPFFR